MLFYLSLFLVSLSVVGLLSSGKIATSIGLRQLIGLAIAFSITSFTVVTNGGKFLTMGNLSASPSPIDWLGISADSTWLRTSIELLLTVVSVTLIFLFLSLQRSRPLPQFRTSIILWSILFAFTNSLTEELIFRFSLLNLINDHVSVFVASMISAIFFGLAHYKGMPNGIIGVLMASFLGFVLAKSVLETNGLLIAWGIHFILDIPIFITLLWTSKAAGKSS